MKIIHTYIPTDTTVITKDLIYCMALSALLAKRNYSNITLYTNKEIGALVKKIGIPYSEVNTTLLQDVKAKVFSIPKIIVYSVQEEPFIHIDLDTFIYKNIDFGSIFKIYSTYKEGTDSMIGFNKGDLIFYDTYIKNAFAMQPDLPDEFLPHVKFSEIPNMSIFGGHNFQLIADASKYCLEIYKKEQYFLEHAYYNACIIEQLFISSAIRMLIGNQDAVHDNHKIGFNFVFPKNPTIIKFTHDHSWDYPFEIETNTETKKMRNDNDLFTNAVYEFGGFLHLNGYKNFSKLMFFIKSKILFDFIEGRYIIQKINDVFPDQTMSDELHKKYLSYLSDKINPIKKVI